MLALLTACGQDTPDDILSSNRMEDVLYDYHLAMGLSGNDFNRSYEKEAFRKFVLSKHGITEADFDSSMVWYTRHSEQLAAIYENLAQRFGKEHERIDMLVEGQKEDTRFASGDTVDIWKKKRLYRLAEAPLTNQLIVQVKPDTTFHPKDAFLWEMDYRFLSPGKAVMGLNVVYDNDSVVGQTQTITRSGHYAIRLHSDSAYTIKNLNGFIQMMDDSTSQKSHLLVHGISLTRYHAKNDSTATSTLADPQSVISNENGTK